MWYKHVDFARDPALTIPEFSSTRALSRPTTSNPCLDELVSRLWPDGPVASCDPQPLVEALKAVLHDAQSPELALAVIGIAEQLAGCETFREELEAQGFAYSVSELALANAPDTHFFEVCCAFLLKTARRFDDRMFRNYVVFTDMCDGPALKATAPMIWVLATTALTASDSACRRFVKPLARLVSAGEIRYSILSCDLVSRFSASFCRSVALSHVPQVIVQNLQYMENLTAAMSFLGRVFQANPFATSLARDLDYCEVLGAMSGAVDAGCACAAVKLMASAANLKPVPLEMARRVTEELVMIAAMESTPFELKRACLLALCELANCEAVDARFYDAVANTWWADDLDLTRETLQFVLRQPRVPEAVANDVEVLTYLASCGSEEIEAMARSILE